MGGRWGVVDPPSPSWWGGPPPHPTSFPSAFLCMCAESGCLASCPPDAATELRLSAGLCHWVVPDLRTGGCQAFFAAWEEACGVRFVVVWHQSITLRSPEGGSLFLSSSLVPSLVFLSPRCQRTCAILVALCGGPCSPLASVDPTIPQGSFFLLNGSFLLRQVVAVRPELLWRPRGDDEGGNHRPDFQNRSVAPSCRLRSRRVAALPPPAG